MKLEQPEMEEGLGAAVVHKEVAVEQLLELTLHPHEVDHSFG